MLLSLLHQNQTKHVAAQTLPIPPTTGLPGRSQYLKLDDGKDHSHQYMQDQVHPGSGQWKRR